MGGVLVMGLWSPHYSYRRQRVRKSWTAADDIRLGKEWAAMAFADYIAKDFGISESAVRARIKRLGLHRKKGSPFWPPERKAQLAKLWAKGLSATLIAVEMQTTRNAVLGARYRMKLPSRVPTSTIRRARVYKKRQRISNYVPSIAAKLRAANHTPKPTGPDHFEGHGIGITELQSDSCRWPYNDRTYCGQKQFDGCPYCGAHALLAYRATAA